MIEAAIVAGMLLVVATCYVLAFVVAWWWP